MNDAADNTGISQNAVQSIFNEIREQIAGDIKTNDKIGGPGTILEIEGKFGKKKYNRGRVVDGSWDIGGVQRHSRQVFLTVCSQNSRSQATLLPIIQRHVALVTFIISDKWKADINLGQHGYIHENGAHTNSIKGTWTHVKNRVLRRGGRRTGASLNADLSLFMWLRQKELLSSPEKSRLNFA